MNNYPAKVGGVLLKLEINFKQGVFFKGVIAEFQKNSNFKDSLNF